MKEFVLSNVNFLDVPQENADGFFMDDRTTTEYPQFTRDVCMTDCKDNTEITMRAAVVDVTPEETAELAAEAEPKVVEAETTAPEVVEKVEEPAKEPEVAALNEELVAGWCKGFQEM